LDEVREQIHIEMDKAARVLCVLLQPWQTGCADSLGTAQLGCLDLLGDTPHRLDERTCWVPRRLDVRTCWVPHRLNAWTWWLFLRSFSSGNLRSPGRREMKDGSEQWSVRRVGSPSPFFIQMQINKQEKEE
jgi:hypothetical protein